MGTDKDREAQLVSGALAKGLGGWWQQKHHLYSMCWVKHMTSVPSHLPETGHIWREWALDCFSLCSPPPQTSIPSLDPEPYLSLASHVVTPKFTSSNPSNHRRDWRALGCRLINREAWAAPESWSSQGRELCTAWAQTPKPWKPVHNQPSIPLCQEGISLPCRKNSLM